MLDRVPTPPERRASVIWTGTCYLDLANPRTEDIHLSDIARALSRQCRYNGLATRLEWSVGQHSILCYRYARRDGITARASLLDILLHDASEAYIGDMVAPLKAMPSMQGFREVEERLEHVIRARFGLAGGMSPLVKHYDRLALASEKSLLVDPAAGGWGPLPSQRGIPEELLTASAVDIAKTFTYVCRRLANHS